MKKFFWPVFLIAALLFAFKADRFRRNIDRVAIVTVDTMRADHLPLHGYPRSTTQFLPELASQGYIFERAISSSPDLPLALRSLATSRYAFEAAAPNAVTILDSLRAHGFDTAAFSDDPELAAAIGGTSLELSTGVVESARAAATWFQSRDKSKKRAVWLHLNGSREAASNSRVDRLTPAGPELFRYLSENQGLSLGSDGALSPAVVGKIRFHDERIHAVDRAIATFYGRSHHRKKPTMVIITACRGEALDADDDGQRLDDGMVRVPLIVLFSDDRGPRKRLGGLVRHIDIWPTIADLTLPVIQRLTVRAEGRSFATALRNKGNWAGTASAYLERASGSVALVAGARKLVKAGENWRLYDLRVDPLERNDLSASDPGTLKRMRRRIERLARG